MEDFFEELKRRNVYKAATAYVLTAWLIIQVVNTISPNLGLSESVPSAVTKILLAGFPVALVLAWLYELTPNGFRLTKNTSEGYAEEFDIGKKLNVLAITSLSLLVSFMLIERFFFIAPKITNDTNTASIVVLPFKNFSPDEKDSYLGDALTEQIQRGLARISGLNVEGLTSSYYFKDRNEGPRKIGEELQVNYILEGSVQYLEGRLRVSAQLINAATGHALWLNTYDETFDQALEIQESISRKVVRELKVELLPAEENDLSSRLTENSEAYKLYLESRQFSRKREDKALAQAIDLLEQAIELEPNFAAAHAELCFLYMQKHSYGSLDKKTRDEKTSYHIEKALELAPEEPEVLLSKVRYQNRVLGMNKIDTARTIRDLRKVVELNPNIADAHFSLNIQLFQAKQYKLARRHMEKAIELDKHNQHFLVQYANSLDVNYGEPEKALKMIERSISIDSSNHAAHVLKAIILSRAPQGNLVEAFKVRHAYLKRYPSNRVMLNHYLWAALGLDLQPVAEDIATTIQMRFAGTEAIYDNILYYYYFVKDFDRATELVHYLIEQELLSEEEKAQELAYLAYVEENPQKAKNVLEEHIGGLKDDSILQSDLSAPFDDVLISYIIYLQAMDEDGYAEKYIKKLLEVYQEKIDNPALSPGYRNRLQLESYYIADDREMFFAFLEELYFERNEKDWYLELSLDSFSKFKNDSRYQSLFSRIEKDIHRMRAEVIRYLKQEGDWKASWDKELGIN